MSAVYTKTRSGDAITLERASATEIVANGRLVTQQQRHADDMVLCVDGTPRRIRHMDYLRTLALPLGDN